MSRAVWLVVVLIKQPDPRLAIAVIRGWLSNAVIFLRGSQDDGPRIFFPVRAIVGKGDADAVGRARVKRGSYVIHCVGVGLVVAERISEAATHHLRIAHVDRVPCARSFAQHCDRFCGDARNKIDGCVLNGVGVLRRLVRIRCLSTPPELLNRSGLNNGGRIVVDADSAHDRAGRDANEICFAACQKSSRNRTEGGEVPPPPEFRVCRAQMSP